MKKPATSKTVAAIARNTSFAALGCFVSLTTPPKSNDRPYWTVVVRNETDSYSPRYRLTDETRANELAATIAKERGIGIVTKAAPERPVIHTPGQQA